LVEDVLIETYGNHAIWANKSKTSVIRRVKIRVPDIVLSDSRSSAIKIEDAGTANDTLVSFCSVLRGGQGPGDAWHFGLQAYGAPGVSFINNTVESTKTCGVGILAGSTGCIVKNNVVFGSEEYDLVVDGTSSIIRAKNIFDAENAAKTAYVGGTFAAATGVSGGTVTSFADLMTAENDGSALDAASSVTDGRLASDRSLATHAGVVITGVNDGAQTDPWGNTMLTMPNIGVDQFDYAPGFGPWSPNDSALPALTLSPDCPGKLKSAQEWRKVASAKEIQKYTEGQKLAHTIISGDIDALISTGVGQAVIQFQMLFSRVELTASRQYHPLGNTFLSYWNDGATGKWAMSDGTNESVVEFDWVADQLVTVSLDCDGYDMLIGVE
jgi:hypothetical protein